jgi:predicted dehydrogenase
LCHFVQAPRRQRDRQISHVSNQETFENINPDYVVVSNETGRHLETVLILEKLLYKGKLMVEKPLDFKSNTSIKYSFDKFGVGFNLRFYSALIELKKIVANPDLNIYSAEFYYGNYYSNWRDISRQSEQYSSFTSKGGGVIRDFSHEIDLISWLFGKPKINFSIGGRLGDVTVDSDDCWNISATTSSVPLISLHLNSLDSIPRRYIRLLTSSGTFFVDIIKNKITSKNGELTFNSNIEESYKSMHENFLSNDINNVATLSDGLNVDELIYCVEKTRIEV